ncbi:MAG: DNA replication and repair protein RecF, partial [Anaerolineae bacterium]|nr:DNA replication and repair protein RecF [Anaerolineae bacterium]
EALAQYNRVLERRNALLKSLRERGATRDRNGARLGNGARLNNGASEQLEFWDERLIEHGSLIVARRQQAAVDLEALARPVHDDLSGGRERLRLRYLPSFDPHPQADARQMSLTLDLMPSVSLPQKPEAIRPAFEQALRAARGEELARGMTILGPHRDEFRFFDGQIDLHTYGSRGQQRTTVLALKLAEVALMARATGEQPILLLDDVLSELDTDRRRYLCGQLSRVEQALITTTDLGDLTEELRGTATVYRVEQGRLEVVNNNEQAS